MTKNEQNRTAGTSAETVGAALNDASTAWEYGLGKAAEGFDQFLAFNKESVEAVQKSAVAAGEGADAIKSAVFAYSQASLEEGIVATKAMLGSKSVKDFLQVQSGFAKAALENCVAETAKVQELALGTAKSASEPLQASVTALANQFRARTA